MYEKRKVKDIGKSRQGERAELTDDIFLRLTCAKLWLWVCFCWLSLTGCFVVGGGFVCFVVFLIFK